MLICCVCIRARFQTFKCNRHGSGFSSLGGQPVLHLYSLLVLKKTWCVMRSRSPQGNDMQPTVDPCTYRHPQLQLQLQLLAKAGAPNDPSAQWQQIQTRTWVTFLNAYIIRSKQSVRSDVSCLILPICFAISAFVQREWMPPGSNDALAKKVPPPQVSPLFWTQSAPQHRRLVQSRRLSANRCDISHDNDISNHG